MVIVYMKMWKTAKQIQLRDRAAHSIGLAMGPILHGRDSVESTYETVNFIPSTNGKSKPHINKTIIRCCCCCWMRNKDESNKNDTIDKCVTKIADKNNNKHKLNNSSFRSQKNINNFAGSTDSVMAKASS